MNMPECSEQDRKQQRPAPPGGAPVVSGLRAAAVVGLGAIALVGAISLVGVVSRPAGDAGSGAWMLSAVTSPLFVACGAICVACAAGLAVAGAIFWQAGAQERLRRRSARRRQEGGMIIEFALVIPIATMLVLIMIQSSLLMAGNLCVHYAAYCAARSAIVTVPLNLGEFEPRNVVDHPDISEKLLRIKEAAVWAVLPVSCSHSDYRPPDAGILERDLQRFFELYGAEVPGWVRKNLGRKLAYANDQTDVEVSPPANGVSYAPNEDIEVRVHHTFYLSVPYGSAIFARLVRTDSRKLDFARGEYGLRIHARCRLTNEGEQDYVDIEPFPRQMRR